MKMSKSRGFTLIELLVVIAIIGILSSVVLASLNTARSKGSDASIKSQVNNMRAQAALYYDGTGDQSYGADNDSCDSGEMFSSTNSDGLNTLVNGVKSTLGTNTLTCHVASNTYAVSAQLKTSGYYCVDGSGLATTTSSNTISADGDVSCSE